MPENGDEGQIIGNMDGNMDGMTVSMMCAREWGGETNDWRHGWHDCINVCPRMGRRDK